MRAIYTREKIDGVWQPYRNITKQGTRNSHESGPFFINILVPDGNGVKKALLPCGAFLFVQALCPGRIDTTWPAIPY